MTLLVLVAIVYVSMAITLVVYLSNFPITKIIIIIILFAKFMVYNRIFPRLVVIIIIVSIVLNAIVIAKSVAS